MKTLIEPQKTVRCAICQTHTRPEFVPWQQHAVGCLVRARELARHGRARRVGLVAGALHL